MNDFTVSIDLRRRMLRLTLRGFWDIATFDAFAAEFTAALQQLRRVGGAQYALVDGREFKVQSREILERFSQVMRDNAPYLARRTASVVPAELNRMQAARVGESLDRRDFTSLDAAEAWLFGSGEAAA